MVFHTIRAERSTDFELLFERLKTGLTASADEGRKQQIAGWRLLKQNASTAEGHLLYVAVIDPVVAGAEYDMARLLAEVYPAEGAALYQTLLASHVQPTVQATSLTALPAPGRFSTITCWPRFDDMPCATRRAMVSIGPPGGNGTTSLIGLSG